MDIKINMLDVKDGDAIIVELFKHDKTLVMVIDGGNPTSYRNKMRPRLIEILENHKKKAPEIVVCTHYDSDHIGGLVPLLQEYISEIQEVWVHKTPALLQGFLDEAVHLIEQKKKRCGDYKLFTFQNLFEENTPPEKLMLDEKANLIIESLPQLKKLIELIPASKLKQVFHKQHKFLDWEEITVLGPTIAYYSTLFPLPQSFEDFITEECEDILPSGQVPLIMLERAGIKPCDTLKNDNQTKLTETNKASIIIAIDNDNGRYLFTGDAGIQSFKAIPEWDSELKDLYFLKMPHHASDNNISKELIEVMQPVYAYNTGFKYQSEAVLKCIKAKPRNIEVKTTKSDGDLFFE